MTQEMTLQLVGEGKKLKNAALTDARQLVTQYLRRTGQSHWAGITPGTARAVALCSYTLAHKRGDELMWSVAHKRSRSRCLYLPQYQMHTAPTVLLSHCFASCLCGCIAV